ncbi:normal mucosa of esophagus-specific gene 1 protein-like [Artemia franciscana]|uniref:normal mucosa of esophagus-specific gene 1 protein-like n=1 Tax=Artemia franciscana TaxID=6661 RepID=UPI0032DA98AC
MQLTRVLRAQKTGEMRELLKRTGVEVYPLLGIMGVAITGVVSFAMYALFTKDDVVVNKSAKLPPWQRIDLENPKPNKFLVISQSYDEVKPHVVQLLKELDEVKMKE